MGTTTRAAVMWEAGRDWDVVELQLDDPKDREVLVRFEAAGMCHSDDHIRTGDYPVRFPMVGGHEGAGIVEKVGPGVQRVAEGDRVVCSFIPACGVCRWCSTGHQAVCDAGLNASTGAFLDQTFRFHHGATDLGGICALGTFSERAVISEYSCVKLPEDIPFDAGALLSCGVPTGWGSAVYAAGVRAGQTVVVYGCGGVGSNAVQGAALAGARTIVVVDPVPFKREMAKVFGATHTFATHDEALEFLTQSTWGVLADHAIITVGVNSAQTVSQAASIIGKLGTVVITAAGGPGSQIDMASGMLQVYLQRIQGTLAGHTNPLADMPRLMDLYRAGDLKLDELITKRYSLDQVNEMYHDMLDGKNIRGVIVRTA
jgi:alcohol dehydrogenase (nicotinoprotein)